MEKITYLVTNYNNGKYVGDCLQSIVDQENPNWYCIVVDDASEDNSVEVIERFISDQLKLIKNEVNLDQVKSLQKLMQIASTDIVCIVDSDDALESEATNCVIEAFGKSSRIGFVYTNCIEFDEDLKKPLAIGLSERIPFGPTSSIVNGHPGHMRCFRKSVYEKTSGYNTSLLYAEDLDLEYKLEEVCLPYFVNKFVYRHRRLPDTRGKKLENKLLGYKNRKIAKLNAIRRRNIKGLMGFLCKLYVSVEYKKCVHSKKKHKIRKFTYETIMIIAKFIINYFAFKTIKSKI